MKKPVVVTTVLSILALVGASMAGATRGTTTATRSLSATLTAKAVVSPLGKAVSVPASLVNATGTFSATLNDTHSLSWRVSYAKLGSPHLVVADIHVGPPGKFGPILLRLCGPCKPGQQGVVKLKASVARQLVVGKQWLTLITDKYPNGAIRGQIAVK